MYFYVDESGDTVFFDKSGNDLLQTGKVSRIFIVGYLECENPNEIFRTLETIRSNIKNDSYLIPIPSVSKSIKHFHAKDDCPEVREKVFKAILQMNIRCYIIVARKNSLMFKKKFNGETSRFYEYMVEKLFENRLHLYSAIDIYFSKMGNIVREENMGRALQKAKCLFQEKWGKDNLNTIRLFIQEPSHIAPLQVIDYLLWAVNRAYERNDMRFYDFIRDKIIFLLDIFDTEKYPNNFYNAKNPFDIKKISPLNS